MAWYWVLFAFSAVLKVKDFSPVENNTASLKLGSSASVRP